MKTKHSDLGIFQSLAIALGALTLSACSPGALFGNQSDPGIQKQRSYRQVNSSCSQMDLSRSRLDVVSARKLVACLDSQGALGGFAQLVKAMSDDELAPFVDSLNRSFLEKPENLFQAERVLDDLKARGELEGALRGVGGLFEDDNLIARSIAIFRRSYAPSGKVDPLLLKAAQRLSRELTPDHVADALDLGLIAADARSFSSLWKHLEGDRPLPPEVAQGLVAYGRSGSRIGRELIERVRDGSFFRFAEAVVPDDASGIRAQAPRWSAILNDSLAGGGEIAGRLGGLFAALGQPVPCMQGARALRYSPLDVIGEMTALPTKQVRSFVARDKLSQLYVAYPLCAFPAEVAPGYRALVRLADTPAIEPLADILRSAYQIEQNSRRPVAQFVVQALGDPGFQQLLPALSELQARGGWDDLLLLATAPQLRDRSKITGALDALVDPLPGAPASSVYDVLVQGFARVDAAELDGWLKSFRATSAGLAAALRGVRAAFYVNDAHPFLELLRGALADAPGDSALLEALLKASARPEFQASIRELSAMAADGRLKDLLTTTVSLFDRYAARGQTIVHALPPGANAPAMRFEVRHRLASSDLTAWGGAEPLADFGACEKIDFSIRWDQLGGAGLPELPEFEDQLRAVSACVNSDGKYEELAQALELLSRERADRSAPGSGEPRSIHRLLVEAYDAFQFTRSEAAMLADWMLASVSDGRAMRALRAVPIWMHHNVVRPLVDLAQPLITQLDARAGLRRLGVYGASVLKRADIQKLAAYVDDLYRAHPAAPAPVARAPYDRERILRWIGNKECTLLQSQQGGGQGADAAKAARLAAIVEEYENAAVNHAPLVDGKIRRSWTTSELKTELDPIFKKLADIPGNGAVARALMRFAARFSDPEQYPPGYLEQWLRKRANDRRIISYMYPGETLPRVRLVNGLDRLSIALLNADIYAGDPIDMNFGMQFLANISEAWGDVPFEKRPPEIQAKYPKTGHKKCPTIAEAIQDINDTATTFYSLVGFPKLPHCAQLANPSDPPAIQQAETTDPTIPPGTDPPPPDAPPGSDVAMLQSSMFNIAETIGVLQENVDDGGMRVLRDLFYDLYYTGPAANRDANAGLKNNLSVVMRLVKTGLLRQAGLLIADTSPDDPVIHGFFEALIDGAATTEIGPVAESLFATDADQSLIWNVLDQILKLKAPQDIATAKTIGLYGMASLDSLGRSRTRTANELLGPLLRALQPIIAQHGMLLAKHADLVGDLVTWSDGADFLRALAADRSPVRGSLTDLIGNAASEPQRGLDLMAMLKALDSSSQAHQAWDDFRASWKSLDQLAEYRSLRLGELGRQMLDFAEARSADGTPLPADQAALSRKLLMITAGVLERNDLELVDQLLALAQRKPDEFYRMLDSISRLVENGEIQSLLDLINTKLGPPAA